MKSMLKKSIISILLLCIGTFFSITQANSNTNYLNSLTSKDIYTTISYSQSLYQLSKICPIQVITKTQLKEKTLIVAINQLLTKKNIVEQRYMSKNLFGQIQSILAKQSSITSPTDKQCEIHYLLISLMQQLREHHLKIIYDDKMDADFANSENKSNQIQ